MTDQELDEHDCTLSPEDGCDCQRLEKCDCCGKTYVMKDSCLCDNCKKKPHCIFPKNS